MVTPTDWLAPVIEDAIRRRLCTRIGCSTCGATDFLTNVQKAIQDELGASGQVAQVNMPLVLAQGLAQLKPSAEKEACFEGPAQFLLYDLWLRGKLGEMLL